jgi:hypothetical protein
VNINDIPTDSLLEQIDNRIQKLQIDVKLATPGSVEEYVLCEEVEFLENWYNNILEDQNPIDFSCEICGAPEMWPVCGECERKGYIY